MSIFRGFQRCHKGLQVSQLCAAAKPNSTGGKLDARRVNISQIERVFSDFKEND